MADKMNPDMIFILAKQGKELGRGHDGNRYIVLDGKTYRINKDGVFLEGDYFEFMEKTRQGGMDFVAIGANGDIPLEHRSFRVEDLDMDGTELGGGIVGLVSHDNAYISMYPVIEDGRVEPKELAVGEGTIGKYNLCGSSRKYRIRRMF